MTRTYAVLEDRENLDWVGDRLGLIPWSPAERAVAGARYRSAADLLRALASAALLPDVILLDDAVPRDSGRKREMDAFASAVAGCIRRMAAFRQVPQPRLVAFTATAVDGQDLLAMLEFGADDVVLKGEVHPAKIGGDSEEGPHDLPTSQYLRDIHRAIDSSLEPGHATVARTISARHWPPTGEWPADMQAATRRQLAQALRVLPLWEAGIVDEEIVNRHLVVTEREIVEELRGLNRFYVRRIDKQVDAHGGLIKKLKEKRNPLRGTIVEGARHDGLLWIRESARRRAIVLWREVLVAENPRLGAAAPMPLASTTLPHLREFLYPMCGDLRKEYGGGWIYEVRRT